MRVSWEVPRLGEFAYDTSVALTRRDDRWLVAFTPRAIHPQLTARHPARHGDRRRRTAATCWTATAAR